MQYNLCCFRFNLFFIWQVCYCCVLVHVNIAERNLRAFFRYHKTELTFRLIELIFYAFHSLISYEHLKIRKTQTYLNTSNCVSK